MKSQDKEIDEILMSYKRYPYGTDDYPHISGDEAKEQILSLKKRWQDEARKPLEKRIFEDNLIFDKLIRISKRYSLVNYIKNYNEAIKRDWQDLRVPIIRDVELYDGEDFNQLKREDKK